MIKHWSIVRSLQAFIAAALSGTAIICFAGNLSGVQGLIAESRFAEALGEIEKISATDPDDPEVLFLKAIALDRSGNTDAAVAIYHQLTKHHPNFPEPFNNLAVHYAKQGDYDLAIRTLEEAFQSNESYRVTYQNLTAVFGKLASEAYRKALNSKTPPISLELAALEAISRPALTGKETIIATVESEQADLEEIRNAATSTSDDTIPTATVGNEVSGENLPVDQESSNEQDSSEDEFEAVVEETVVTVTNSRAVESDQDNIEETENAATSTGIDPIPDATIETEDPVKNVRAEPGSGHIQESAKEDFDAVTGESELAVPESEVQALHPEWTSDPIKSGDSSEVAQRVMSWANSWASQDLDLYLSHYSSDFVPMGLSLDAWKEQKRGQVLFSEFIVVELSNLDINVDGNTASAQFLQYYKSNTYEGSGVKTLKLSHVNGEWYIVKELI